MAKTFKSSQNQWIFIASSLFSIIVIMIIFVKIMY